MVRTSQPHPEITVYDEVFTEEQQNFIVYSCQQMKFRIGTLDNSDEMYIYSMIPGTVWRESSNEFIKIFEKTKPYREYSNRTMNNVITTLHTIADSEVKGAYLGTDVIMYYANTGWRPECGGDIFFYDQYGKSVISAIQCVPNRMVVFNGDLIHKINTPRNCVGPLTTITSMFERKAPSSTSHSHVARAPSSFAEKETNLNS